MFNMNVAARLKILTLMFYDLVFLDSSIFDNDPYILMLEKEGHPEFCIRFV